MAYAARTKVTTLATRSEIERLLLRAGAQAFAYGQDGAAVNIAFRMKGRHYRFTVKMPDNDQALRSRWRALLLIIKAKLEAVAAGVSTFEDEFLGETVTPSGQTVQEWLRPQIEDAYKLGRMPKQLILEGPR
jgi:hypothetical protein